MSVLTTISSFTRRTERIYKIRVVFAEGKAPPGRKHFIGHFKKSVYIRPFFEIKKRYNRERERETNLQLFFTHKIIPLRDRLPLGILQIRYVYK